ncbi:unnamed protein product [Rotaria socialis]|uniref:EGF-like domain-containing protein n=2 Tax=Rotaria socialis TaxID=392032 RepID=A0A821WZ09_9BILA|nr:unnamed protein product [Rotaria socialis]
MMCQIDPYTSCKNGGQCIPIDEHMATETKFTCICPKYFTGDRCEIADTKIILSFQNDITLSRSMIVHFIQVLDYSSHERATTVKTIPIEKNSLIIYWSRPFHIVLFELFNKTYYLTVVQKRYNPSQVIVKTLNSSDRCKHISEVFNETIVNLHLLRRIKYYHLPCQKHSSYLSCFYDDIHFCLCNTSSQHQHVANCFEFDHNLKPDCFGQNSCENGAQCFQDSPTCAPTSMCTCPTCFYGRRCQFSTNGFGLSIDAILGYHILPNVSIVKQPYVVDSHDHAGLFSGVLSVIMFQSKKLCEAGCDLYLLISFITTVFTVILVALKLWILVLAQMALTTNRSFLGL